ncbi:MAG: hypothetical protein R3A52_12765 [Polyangiales bacterium]
MDLRGTLHRAFAAFTGGVVAGAFAGALAGALLEHDGLRAFAPNAALGVPPGACFGALLALACSASAAADAPRCARGCSTTASAWRR